MTETAVLSLISNRLATLTTSMDGVKSDVSALLQGFNVMLEIQQGQGEMLREILDRASKAPGPSPVAQALSQLAENVKLNTEVLRDVGKAIAEIPAAVEERVVVAVHAATHDGELPPGH